MHTLNLSSALADDEELATVAAAVATNRSLKYLSLHQCPISEQGLLALTAALRQNHTCVASRPPLCFYFLSFIFRLMFYHRLLLFHLHWFVTNLLHCLSFLSS
jgi:hypothetical protein